ncbi:MAG: hypothetical protein ABJM06_07005 [Gilvibacter sp.]
MKTILLIAIQFLFIFPTLAQEPEADTNPINTTRQGFGDMRGIMTAVGFVNPKARTEGSAYYYEDWDSEAMIYLKEQGRYKVSQVNINLYDNTLDALYDDDNVFTFDTKELLQIVIDKTIFRPFELDKKLRILELFYNNKTPIYKHYYISYSKSSANPMINRRTNKYIKNVSYYVFRDGELIKMKLSRKAIAKLFTSDTLSEDAIESYIRDNHLSLKKEADLIQVLNFVNK